MSQETTRFAVVSPHVRHLRSEDGTHAVRARLLRHVPPGQLVSAQRDALEALHARTPRLGLLVVAIHQVMGVLGHLWLEATDCLRAGTLGRHAAVDLALPLDESLSLRHLLFVVRRAEDGVRFLALDLQSLNGSDLERARSGTLETTPEPRLVEVGDFILACFPSGTPTDWDALVERRSSTRPSPVRPPGGVLDAWGEESRESVEVPPEALSRGFLLGRDGRCDLVLEGEAISRVHAALVCIDGTAFLVDTASTNGTWQEDQEVRMGPIEDGQVYTLARRVHVRWRPAAERHGQ